MKKKELDEFKISIGFKRWDRQAVQYCCNFGHLDSKVIIANKTCSMLILNKMKDDRFRKPTGWYRLIITAQKIAKDQEWWSEEEATSCAAGQIWKTNTWSEPTIWYRPKWQCTHDNSLDETVTGSLEIVLTPFFRMQSPHNILTKMDNTHQDRQRSRGTSSYNGHCVHASQRSRMKKLPIN